jgi:hypothetical protein
MEWRTVTLESWDSSAWTGDESCAAPEATANVIIPQANHIRFLDGPCRLLTIRDFN